MSDHIFKQEQAIAEALLAEQEAPPPDAPSGPPPADPVPVAYPMILGNNRPFRDITAEIGTERRRFGSAKRLSSWAGVSPGNNESAGKRRKGRTRKGNRYLRRVLVQCAWAARKTPTFLGRTFRR